MSEEASKTDQINESKWKEKFLKIAFEESWKSNDEKTQVGACVVDENNEVVGKGYNHMPGNLDYSFPQGKNGGLEDKRTFVCHAEMNAVLNAKPKTDLKKCTLYVTLHPCNECAKLIIRSGIKKVFYVDKKRDYTSPSLAAAEMFNKFGDICEHVDHKLDYDYKPIEYGSREHVYKHFAYDDKSELFKCLEVALAEKANSNLKTKIGACIFDKNNEVVGRGYNHHVYDLKKDESSKPPIERQFFVCHAEMNAIVDTKPCTNLEECTLFVTQHPCNECAKLIIQSGITQVFYIKEEGACKDSETEDFEVKAAKKMFKKLKVKCEPIDLGGSTSEKAEKKGRKRKLSTEDTDS